MNGSSPRERGTQGRMDEPALGLRFIPARAGNAPPGAGQWSSLPVHPRASGEREGMGHLQRDAAGSSPRERGTLRRRRAVLSPDRFIPARAGNAWTPGCGPRPTTVYPRASGERGCRKRPTISGSGSSPRERGTRMQAEPVAGAIRFIPARAGNAGAPSTPPAFGTVHPRASGERDRKRVNGRATAGSSPRERGTPCRAVFALAKVRFIPARAGNAISTPSWSRSSAVHPRASGERGPFFPQTRPSAGSSPRERGTREPCVRERRTKRFIPARAGNARRVPRLESRAPVHPRASGERRDDRDFIRRTFGSSPRERGTLARPSPPITVSRFIPARAGNAHRWGLEFSLEPVHPRASGERLAEAIGAAPELGSSPRERGTLT